VVCGDNLAQILGIEPRGQGRRADQVAKHHRELATLGAVGTWRWGRGWRSGSRLAATTAEIGAGLIVETAGGAGHRQWRPALGTKAPSVPVFDHAL
jgi:hypothetical protein